MRKEAKSWWLQANKDFLAAKNSFKSSDYYVASFLCQQAVEKALKALLLERKLQVIKTHDLLFLANKVNLPEELIGNCKILSPIYIETRYPDANGEFRRYTKNETKEDLKLTEKVLSWIEENL